MRTLQLELEYIYGCLEEEALDIGQGTQNPTFLLSRQVRPRQSIGLSKVLTQFTRFKVGDRLDSRTCHQSWIGLQTLIPGRKASQVTFSTFTHRSLSELQRWPMP